jgi:hypothetical protein
MSLPAGKFDSTRGTIDDHSDILEHCLEAIESGQATVESCVIQHPEFTNLGDLLRAATVVRSLPLARLPEPSRSEIRQRMLDKYNARHATRAPVVQRRPTWKLRLVLPVILAIFLVFGAELVRASASAVPGDNLYGLKRVAEQIQLTLADPRYRPDLLYQDAQTRLAEIGILSQRGQPITGSVLADMADAVNAALAAQPDPSVKASLLDQTSTVLDEAQSLGMLDPSAKAGTLAMLSPAQDPTTIPQSTDSAPPTSTNEPATAKSRPAAGSGGPSLPGKPATKTPKPRPTARSTSVGPQSSGNGNSGGNDNAGGNGNGGANGNGNGGKKK